MAQHSKNRERKSMLVLALSFPKAPILWPVSGCLWNTLFRRNWVILGLSISGTGITSRDVGLFLLKHNIAALSNMNKKHNHYSFERKAKSPFVFIPYSHIYNYVGGLSSKGHASKLQKTFPSKVPVSFVHILTKLLYWFTKTNTR